MDTKERENLEYLANLSRMAFDRGFTSIEQAITAHDAPVVAYMHDGENRFDVVHAKVKEVWDGAKPNHVEHYTIPLVRKAAQ